jgi:hypothetical protein
MQFYRPIFLPRLALLVCTVAGCFFSATVTAFGQNSILLFSPVDQRASATGTGYGTSAVNFNSNTLSLTCSASPITATLSSTADNLGNLLVDNNINVSVTAGGTTTGPTNVCVGGVNGSSIGVPFQNCFSSGYEFPPSGTSYLGQDPDTFAATGGVPPISISSLLRPGTEQVTISLQDEGFYLASSTIYLNTNCSQNGVTGPALVNGNPIPSTSATPQQLTQGFSFDSTSSQQIGFQYDLTAAQSAGSLTITNGTIPQVVDLPLDPSSFQSKYAPQTSFATSNCLVHSGELLPNGQLACKLFTLQCAVGTGATASGAQCPVSSQTNEIIQDVFDGPAFTLSDIPTPGGPTFHEGIGFLMASDGWVGGPCTFEAAADLGNLDCPQNLLYSFTSAPAAPASQSLAKSRVSANALGAESNLGVKSAGSSVVHPEVVASGSTSTSSGRTTHPNSTFITVVQVPEPLTTVTLDGAKPFGYPPTIAPGTYYPSYWFHSTPVVTFSTQPPNLSGTTLPGAATFVPSPIQSLTYGVSAQGQVPVPGTSPTGPAGDVALTNSAPCPIPPNLTNPPAAVFEPGQQTLTGLAEGNYAIYYYAQDCAGTQELQFKQDAGGNWSTGYYTVPFGVDRTPPTIQIVGPTPGVFQVGQGGSVYFNCSDNLSGVAKCGNYSTANALPNPISQTLNTSSPGVKTLTLTAYDFAGNTASVPYQYTVFPAVDSQVQIADSPITTTYPGNRVISITLNPGTNPTFAPTGTVELVLDGTNLASLNLSGAGHGFASAYYELSGANLNAGQHSLYALYSGDSRNPGGASAHLELTVQPSPVSLYVSCVNPKLLAGVNYSCNVYTKPVAAGASGFITYQYDSSAAVVVPLSGGAASFTIPAPTLGAHTVVVSYAAQPNYLAASSQTLNFTVVAPN